MLHWELSLDSKVVVNWPPNSLKESHISHTLVTTSEAFTSKKSAPVGATYLVVVMQLHWMPLAIADSTCDIWRHCGLCLAWKAKRGKKLISILLVGGHTDLELLKCCLTAKKMQNRWWWWWWSVICANTHKNQYPHYQSSVCMYVGVPLCWFQAKEMVLKYLVFQTLLGE